MPREVGQSEDVMSMYSSSWRTVIVSEHVGGPWLMDWESQIRCFACCFALKQTQRESNCCTQKLNLGVVSESVDGAES